MFGSPSIVSCDLELNMYILQNEGKLFESCYPKPLYDILGNSSLILVHGDLHKKLRTFAVSFINSCRSRTEFLCDVENKVVAMMESWRQRKEVFFCEEAKKVFVSKSVFNLLEKLFVSKLMINLLGKCKDEMMKINFLKIIISGSSVILHY